MTTSQAMRYERRRQRELERKQRIREAAYAAALITFVLLVFGWAGALDCQADQAELARWEAQGVTIQRW